MGHVRLGKVAIFLLPTFGLTWGIDWLIAGVWSRGLYGDFGMTPFGMFIPATVALVLRLFVFRDSPIHIAAFREAPRWIFLGFLALTLGYGIVVATVLAFPRGREVLSGVGAVLLTLWTLMVFFVFGRSTPQALRRAGLSLGDTGKGSWFVLGTVFFLLLQSLLNVLSGLGSLQGSVGRIYGIPVPAALHIPVLVLLFVAVAVIGVPLSGLAATFGEEYGWRGYLQDELTRLGRLQGVFLVGVVWGLWHLPVILSGVHTYPPTSLGVALGMAFFLLWGFVQSYSVLKTGGIWVAALLHGVVNSVYGFLLSYVARPSDNVVSFGLGVFGLLCLGVVVILILRDPLWREGGGPQGSRE